MDRPLFLSIASETYRDAGIVDTSYIYARQLTKQTNPSNKRTGYKVIFSDKLRDYVPKDTLIALVSEYKNAIENFVNKHDGENAIIQNTKYNYVIHDRQRINAEKKLYIYTTISATAIILSLILLAIILYRKFRKADTEASFVAAINILKESTELPLEEKEIKKECVTSTSDLGSNEADTPPTNETSTLDYPKSHNPEHPEKLADIKKRIMSGIKTSDDKDINSLVNPTILASQLYRNLYEKIESEHSITNSEEKIVYKKLDELIESASAGFSYRLRVLTEDKITPVERRVAMLMKCGFSPLQISILFGREKNTISTHRRNLAFKITGQKKAAKSLDLIIISL